VQVDVQPLLLLVAVAEHLLTLCCRYASKELVQLSLVSLCLSTAWVCGRLGLSEELGAFIAGVMMSVAEPQADFCRSAEVCAASSARLIHKQFYQQMNTSAVSESNLGLSCDLALYCCSSDAQRGRWPVGSRQYDPQHAAG